MLNINISSFIAKCETALLGCSPAIVNYHDRVCLKNNQLPEPLGKNPVNVYALWVRSSLEANWVLMYIGQRKAKNGCGRIKQHLFATPNGTQSKLLQVRAAIEAGFEIGVTSILVEPDSMRLAVEEELINRSKRLSTDIPWNIKSRAPQKK